VRGGDYVFDRLVERLRWASERTQFLIATHSPTLVNRLRAKELIVCERDPRTGESLIPAADPKDVRAMEKRAKGRMGLGELWFTGSLGGVPR
jgi:predicted ATPase